MPFHPRSIPLNEIALVLTQVHRVHKVLPWLYYRGSMNRVDEFLSEMKLPIVINVGELCLGWSGWASCVLKRRFCVLWKFRWVSVTGCPISEWSCPPLLMPNSCRPSLVTGTWRPQCALKKTEVKGWGLAITFACQTPTLHLFILFFLSPSSVITYLLAGLHIIW